MAIHKISEKLSAFAVSREILTFNKFKNIILFETENYEEKFQDYGICQHGAFGFFS